MAKVAAVTWFPRTYINLFETFIGLEKADLKIRDVDYGGKNLFNAVEGLSFTIEGYKDYPPISFAQGWSGLHYFVVELPDEGVGAAADKFMKEMQVLLLEKILKVCHTVTYKNIAGDLMPLDFHTLVLTKGEVDTAGYTVEQAGDLTIACRPRDVYYGGTMSYVMGSDDVGLLKVLLYHAYIEVGSDFVYNMMKAMIRLFHGADTLVDDVEGSKNMKELKDNLTVLESVIGECSSRSGKMKHVLLNFKLKEEEFHAMSLTNEEEALVRAFGVKDSFKRLAADGAYLEILWGSIMENKVRDINAVLDMRLRIKGWEREKKGWL